MTLFLSTPLLIGVRLVPTDYDFQCLICKFHHRVHITVSNISKYLPALMTAWDFSFKDWGISFPLVTSRAAGKFIEDMVAFAKFVASCNLSNSFLTSSFLRVSKAPKAWWTAKGHRASNRTLSSGLPVSRITLLFGC